MQQAEPANLSHAPVQPDGHPPGYRLRRGRNWVFLGLTYASYYLCRYNLSPIAPELMRDLGLSSTQYGRIQSGRDGAYAIGQMVNGLFTDRIGGKLAMTLGGIGTILFNLLFGFVSWSTLAAGLPIILMLIRSADGYCQAFGSPGFIKINTAWFPRRERGAFAGIFGFMINLGAMGSVQLGKTLIMGLSIPLLFFTITVPVLDWRYMFFIPPIVVAVIVILMNVMVKNQPEDAGFHIQHDEEPPMAQTGERVRLVDVFRKIASNKVVWIVAAAYFCTGFVRRGVESWWAVYLTDVWSADKKSVWYSILGFGIPITAAFGSLFSGYLSDRVFKGKRAPVAAVLYLLQVVFILAALWAPHGGSKGSIGMGVGLIIAISMMCNSTHSILGTAAAMDLGGRKMAGCASGIIDSFQYYGAILSGWGLGAIFDAIGKSGAAATGHAAKQINPTAWFGSMLPFGIVGMILMGYLTWKHRGASTAGA